MVLKADQERLKSLLKDTITLLCKNGLTFTSEFSIDAVIGITLDKHDVLLVSINEQIHSEKSLPETRDCTPQNGRNLSETVLSTDADQCEEDACHKKHKPHIKADRETHRCMTDESGLSESDLVKRMEEWQGHKRAKLELSCENKPETGLQEVTFIKEEVEISKQTSDSADNNVTSYVAGQLTSTSDQENGTLWDQTFRDQSLYTSQQSSQLTENGTDASEQGNNFVDQQMYPLSSAATRGRFLYNPQSTQKRSNNSQRPFTCDICGQSFAQAHCVRRHVLSVHEKVRFFCPYCSHSCSRQDNLRNHIRSCHCSPADPTNGSHSA